MNHVISDFITVEQDGESVRVPRVAHLLECPFACSDGAFEIPPEVPAHAVPSEYAVVALLDGDYENAVAAGFTPVVSLDPCEVSG